MGWKGQRLLELGLAKESLVVDFGFGDFLEHLLVGKGRESFDPCSLEIGLYHMIGGQCPISSCDQGC